MQAIQSIEQMNKSIFGSFNTKFLCIFIFLVFWLDNKKKYNKPLAMSDKLLLMNKHLLLMLCFFWFFAFTFAGWISRFFHGFFFHSRIFFLDFGAVIKFFLFWHHKRSDWQDYYLFKSRWKQKKWKRCSFASALSNFVMKLEKNKLSIARKVVWQLVFSLRYFIWWNELCKCLL